ncbi:MAG: transcription antitermination factor NusB [Oscillospiraceae bacterium]
MTRRESRKTAFSLVFQLPVNELSYGELLDISSEDEEIVLDDFCLEIVKNTVDCLLQIDEEIKPHLKKWTINRLPMVSLAILRISCAQLMYMTDLPDSVVINEAVELAKEFGNDDEYAFVNGTLRSINNSLKGITAVEQD